MPGVTFVGTGDAFDAEQPGVSILYAGARAVLVDCGTSVPPSFWRITRDPDLLDGIYVTEPHADRGFGVPALLAWMRHAGRERPLDVLGGPAVLEWLDQVLALGYPDPAALGPPFEIRQVALSPERCLDYGPVRIRVAATRQPGTCLAVRLEEATGSVCFSGRGVPTFATRRLYDGASVLVHACAPLDGDSASGALLVDLLELKRERAIERLCLVQLDASRRDALRADVGRMDSVVVPAPGDQLFVGSMEYRAGGEWL